MVGKSATITLKIDSNAILPTQRNQCGSVLSNSVQTKIETPPDTLPIRKAASVSRYVHNLSRYVHNRG